MVILHFRLSLWDNELKFKSNEPDITAVTPAEEAEEHGGYNFLNPPLFYVRTLLTLEADTSADAGRRFKRNISDLSHLSPLKLTESFK